MTTDGRGRVAAHAALSLLPALLLLLSGCAPGPGDRAAARESTAGPTGAASGPQTPGDSTPDGDTPEEPLFRSTPTSRPPTDPPATPETLRLPSLTITMPIRPVGVRADGQMELPPDPAAVGWYRYGSAPGSGSGTVVLGGHVDSRQRGLGPLRNLERISDGDPVIIATSDGRQQYRVTATRTVDKDWLPTRQLFTRTGPERVAIITCIGPYLPWRGGYQQNLVVIAEPAV